LARGYKTKAKNFKANLRIMLYAKKKGLYEKRGPGKFALASTNVNKTPRKRKLLKKAVNKNKTVKTESSKRIVQPSLPSLIVEVLRGKKAPLRIFGEGKKSATHSFMLSIRLR